MAVTRVKPGNYPACLSYGFRPFFLLGALYAALTILIWLPLFYGHLETYSFLTPVDWHIHEMLFGYLAAIITGFLLTAIPNWTGRLPVQGLPLFLLVLVWLLGRLAVFFSYEIGWTAAVVDCAFLLLVVIAAAIEIIAGKNWQNLKILLPLTVFFASNVLFYFEIFYTGTADISRRLGIGIVVILVAVIGGRVIPSFTRNWLVKTGSEKLPIPYNQFDKITILITVLSMLLWAFLPDNIMTSVVLLIASAFQFLRLGRWAGAYTLKEPIVIIMHIAYAFVPVGLLLIGLAIILPVLVPPAAGLHAIGIGAFGAMTIAIMTRASLGHTGRKLKANAGTCVIYASIIISVLCRIVASFMPADTVLMHISALGWVIAFLGFALCYGKILVTPRLGK